jgi:ankyrin repeat protein
MCLVRFAMLRRTDHGHTEMVQMLLDAGADPAAADENRKPCLAMSKEAQKPHIEKLLHEALALRQDAKDKDET